jgi:hypothetical protein
MTECAAALPEGWFWSDEDDRSRLSDEYMREMPPIHPLAGIRIQVVAHREGNDDILVRCLDEPDHVAVVHLSWRGREEIANHRTAEYAGTFRGFIAWARDTYGVGLHPHRAPDDWF